MRALRRLMPAALAALSLPLLAGAGTCGIIYEISQRALVLDPIVRLDFESDSGGLEVFAFDRNGTVVSYALKGFDASLEDIGHALDGDVLRAFILRGGPAEISADFYFEVARGTELTLRVESGPVTLTALDAPVSGAVNEGDVVGVALTTPTFELEVAAGDVDLEWAAPPVALRLEVAAGDVTLALPAGAYRCALDDADGAPQLDGVTCDPAAAGELAVSAPGGHIRVQGK